MYTPTFYTKRTVAVEGSHETFVFEPLAQGFGQTLGNSYRRTLLSAIPGAVITAVKFAGVPHLFTTLPGVKESLLDIVLQLKQVRFKVPKEGTYAMSLIAKGEGKIYAKDIEGDVEVVNKDLYIAEITTEKGKIDFEAIVQFGYGFSPTEEREATEAGYIAIDASFSPVQMVNFTVEDARVGRKSNYEKLTLEVKTDGSISPEDAIKMVNKILIAHYSHVFSGADVAPVVTEKDASAVIISNDRSKALETIIDELNLPSRVINALLREKIETVADLLKRGKSDLVGLKGVGRKSIDLIDEELKKMGVELA